MTRLNTETLEQFAAENDLLLSDPLICFANMVSEAAVHKSLNAENYSPQTLVSNKAKWWAIDECLSGYPDDVGPDKVIALVEEESRDVRHWEPFEHWDGGYLAGHITGLASRVQKIIDGE